MLLGRVKKVISGLVALSMLTTFAVPSGMAKAADSSELKNPVVSKTETTWDRVVFGSYYSEVQEKDVPITWRVLNVSGNDAFLISDEILAMKNYNDEARQLHGQTVLLEAGSMMIFSIMHLRKKKERQSCNVGQTLEHGNKIITLI